MTVETDRRWRLILGAHGDGKEGGQELSAVDRERDEALAFLFERERGIDGESLRDDVGVGVGARGAGREDSTLTPVTWLGKVRRVFPRSTVETLQKTAIERYGLVSLLNDPEALESATPTVELVTTLLSFHPVLQPSVMAAVRRIIAKLIKELEDKLSRRVRQLFGGRRRRHQHFGRPVLSNLDWQRTLQRNLKHYDAEHETVVLERLYFNPRDQRRVPWHLYLVVDQSGSMAASVIHSAIVGSVFMRVPSIEAHLLLFDTQVVDLSTQLADPLETLLSVQLGGGTDIANALAHVRTLIRQPRRSMLVLVTDFDEGGAVDELVGHVSALRQSGVKLLGLGALTEEAHAYVNQTVAEQVTAAGMSVGTATPDRLAAWVADQMN